MVLRSSRIRVGFSTAPPALIMVLNLASSVLSSVIFFARSSGDMSLISLSRSMGIIAFVSSVFVVSSVFCSGISSVFRGWWCFLAVFLLFFPLWFSTVVSSVGSSVGSSTFSGFQLIFLLAFRYFFFRRQFRGNFDSVRENGVWGHYLYSYADDAGFKLNVNFGFPHVLQRGFAASWEVACSELFEPGSFGS